jgi:hypothetical protein
MSSINRRRIARTATEISIGPTASLTLLLTSLLTSLPLLSLPWLAVAAIAVAMAVQLNQMAADVSRPVGRRTGCASC